MAGIWRFNIDRGGTFTDIVAFDPEGRRRTEKLLSESPGAYEDAAIEGIRRLTGVREGALPPLELRIGTTIATNALLERKGAHVVLVTTEGFGDALRIGTQERPDLFARAIRKPAPLYERVIETSARVSAEGEILVQLDEAAARRAMEQAFADGFRSVAISLMHGARFPDHEERLAAIAEAIGFPQISVGHRVSPLIRLIGRGDTTVADAYLSPIIRRYVEHLSGALGGSRPLFMQSSGALAEGQSFSGKDAILSGPAGGIVGMARTAEAAGFAHVIGFDMGGTSTDVSHYAGQFERDGETVVAGQRIRTPMLRIHTVAAGGGSVCRITGGRFTVGPESAGAVPGPACYRRGGPLTVTDCNLMLGKLQPKHFPKLFGADGKQVLDAEAVRRRFDELATAAADAGLAPRSAEQAAEGFVTIAVANMARAIRKISIERGHDITGAVLACFGGAGGQHACLVADALGLEQVMIHPLAGILSAHGIGLADRGMVRDVTVGAPVDEALPALLDAISNRLFGEIRSALQAQGIEATPVITASAHIRYAGSESLIEVPVGAPEVMRSDFEAGYRARFGFLGSDALVLETLRIEAVVPSRSSESVEALPLESGPPIDRVRVFMAGRWRDADVFDRDRLSAGFEVDGPALVLDSVSTTVVEAGWRLRVDGLGNLILQRTIALPSSASDAACDPIRLEIFSGLFMGLAEEMGAALQQSAASVNIRERLDFSCALFDPAGNLVANAPHMPVHLGSMGDSIRAIMETRGASMRNGDAFALNNPYRGGTHLPDVTVVMPVFVPGETSPAFFVAARGHHADIGGISPGSMPPASRDVREEGVLIDSLPIVAAGAFLEDEVRGVLGAGRWPARDPDRNIADLKAQVAACARGAEGLRQMVAAHGLGVVHAYMAHVQANAEEAVRALIERLHEGRFRYEMDDGAAVEVAVRIDRENRSAVVDFTGTSPQQPSNFNAPRSITRAAVLYVFRTLVDEPIPLNDGCLAPIEIIVPEGSMLSPSFPAAVVAGNVETSQVVTDALFGALNSMAGAQGTMNNFTFGNDRHQYYETIAGGSGAGPGFDGASVVQTHMTNSRLTDPEILETRFPVLLERFSIREGSGGHGLSRGGDGGVRRIRFREAMQAGILANRRRVAPFGLEGGQDGAVGRNWVERVDGSRVVLGATGSAEVQPGDVFVIETPGGGGFGHTQ